MQPTFRPHQSNYYFFLISHLVFGVRGVRLNPDRELKGSFGDDAPTIFFYSQGLNPKFLIKDEAISPLHHDHVGNLTTIISTSLQAHLWPIRF